MKTEGFKWDWLEVSFNMLNSKSDDSKALIQDAVDRLWVSSIIINAEKAGDYFLENLDFFIMIESDYFMRLQKLKLNYSKVWNSINSFLKTICNIRETVNKFEVEWIQSESKSFPILTSKWVTVVSSGFYNEEQIQVKIFDVKMWLSEIEIIEINESSIIAASSIINTHMYIIVYKCHYIVYQEILAR